jgi:phage terminase large subunit GpA-like protein
MAIIAKVGQLKTDPVSRAAIHRTIIDLRSRNFAPWAIMDPIAWATTVRRMPDEHGATKPFTFDFAPYEREPFLECFNPRNQEVILQMFSRGGKSEIVLNVLGYIIHQRPCRIGSMWPTQGQAQKWSKDDLNGALIDPTPELFDLVGSGEGRRKSDNTILHKLFRGGLMDIVGANAPGDLRRMKARVLYADEIDAIVEIGTDEGDQLAIFKKRGAEFADVIEIYCSYPSLKRRSRIEAKLLETDYRQYFVTCGLCGGEPYVMHRSQLRYDFNRPADARLECPRCGGFLDDGQRYAMMLGGNWKSTREYRGRVGFQANALLWPHVVDLEKYPGGFLQMLAQQEIDVERSDNPERSRRVMVNTVDAETYEVEFEHKPSHTVLFLRREEYDPARMLPAGVLAIFFFVDVHPDRLELFIDGYGLKNQVWGLDYQVIRGTPLSPPEQGCWAELDRILTMTKYPHPSGKYLALNGGDLRNNGGLFDCGYKPDNVFAFTRPRAAQRIFASRGATTLSKPLIGRRAKREGNPPAKVWEVGTNEAKDIIYQRLEIDNPDANGFCHFPKLGQFSEQYFAMLVAEDSEMKRGGDGKFYRAFTCLEGVRNEALDGRVGTMAIERIVKPNYAKLGEALGIKEAPTFQPAPDLIPRSVAEKSQKTGKPQASFVRGKLRPRRGGFVRGW